MFDAIGLARRWTLFGAPSSTRVEGEPCASNGERIWSRCGRSGAAKEACAAEAISAPARAERARPFLS